MAIVIDDVTSAFPVIIQFCPTPFPTIRLTAGFQIIAVNADFLAGLRIRSARCATWINADRHSRRCRYAAQIAVIVDDLSVAFPVVIQAGVMPVTTSGFAACVKIVSMSFDVFAALRVRQANCRR